ncbi:MAG: insulinase family protein [Planctomycetes bacterium]|nr:insulinase family protein [Planctomycetota bacterium]
MAPRADAALRTVFLLALATVLPAQTAATGPVAFTAPDGSRFLLLADASMPLVHWAIATVAQDPPGFAGLSLAVARTALAGTWRSGSRDPEREPAALDRLDTCFQAWYGDRSEANMAALAEAATAANGLADPAAHDRVLATVPMHRPEVQDRSPVVAYVTTTVPAALADVAARVLDRREHSALRELQARWTETTIERGGRHGRDPRSALHAEVLALAMPDHPLLQELAQPGVAMPRRADALRTWQATQRPERTVHVLLGGFDAAATQAMLERMFAATSLPPSPPPPRAVARPIASLRRSMVPGLPSPVVALAFVLPPDADPTVVALAAAWLGGGADSRLGQELPRHGRAAAVTSCRAPWPPTVGGTSLLLLEVEDPSGVQGLADLVLRLAREAAATAPAAATLEAPLAALQREATVVGNDPRRFAVELATAMQLWPDHLPRTRPPERASGAAVRQLLARVLAGQPVVVEGRP